MLETKAEPKIDILTTGIRQTAGYDAGDDPSSGASLDLSCWHPIAASVDRDIIPSKDDIEGRVIDLYNNDGYTAGAIQTHVDNVVGNGLKLNMKVDWDYLGQTEEWGRDYNKEIERNFRAWAWGNSNKVDVTERLNWSAIQSVSYRSFMVHGEILATAENKASNRSKYRTRIRLIDPARLCNPDKNIPESRNKDIRGGIEFKRDGAPVAYWIANRHPRELPNRGRRLEKLTWQRVPAYTRDGRRLVFHAIDPVRAEQSRGISLLTSAVRAAKMLDKIHDATLQAALMQTIYAVAVKSNLDYEKIMEVMGGATTSQKSQMSKVQSFMKERGDYYSRNKVKLEGASVVHLLPEEELQLTQAKSANPEIGGFLDAMRTEIARGQGITLEQYTGDYSKTNFSSGQLSTIVTGKAHSGRRKRVMEPFCSWVLELWLEEHFILNPGLIPQGIKYREDRDSFTRAEWQGPAVIDADPEKSAKASEKRIANGTTTMSYECSLLGLDYEEVIQQQVREMELKKDSGHLELSQEFVTASVPEQPEEPKNDDSKE